MNHRSAIVVALALVSVARVAAEQSTASVHAGGKAQSSVTAPATYGTSLTAYTINAFDFEGASAAVATDYTKDSGRFFTVPGELYAGVNIPNGAVIQGIELQGCDLSRFARLEATLESWVTNPPNVSIEIHGSIGMGADASAVDGCRGWFSPIANVLVGSGRTYQVRVNLNPVAGTGAYFQAVRIYYALRVSPPPGAATFADVPVGSPLHQFVEALFAAGITGGCGGGNYCPNAPITRGQMAVFLAVALGLHWPN
jgi:hypothetical protein